jgi:hypothetical protein
MAPQTEGDLVMGENPTISLAEAMLVATKKSKLEKRRAWFKRYNYNNLDKMRAKNNDYYQETPRHDPCEEQGVVPAEENEYGYRVYFCHHVRII